VIYVRVKLDELRAWTSDRATHDPAQVSPPEASELVPEAGFREGDILVTKRQWGAFAGTDLDAILRERGVRSIVIAGITTNFGVESTARAAIDLGYDIIFVEDAMTSVGAGSHEGAVYGVFPFIGQVRSAEQVIALLGA
jgi:nicotinamidase-related amidase